MDVSEEFKSNLSELIEILNEFGVKNWQNYFEKVRETTKTNLTLGAKQALGTYGGMCSFNDCTLPYHNDKTPKCFVLSEKRIKFNKLHESIFELATKIHQSTT